MRFQFAHNNLNVANLSASLSFYQKALQLTEQYRREKESFTLVFLGDNTTSHLLELTHLNAHPQAYNLGDNEFHLAFTVDDFDAAYALHSAMGCICYENKGMGIYFIADPDGYWIEILPPRE